MKAYKFDVNCNMMLDEWFPEDDFYQYHQDDGWSKDEISALMTAIRGLHDRILKLEDGKL